MSRTSVFLLVVLFSLPVASLAQNGKEVTNLQPLTPGIYLPVRLGRSLHAGGIKPGTPITVTTTQRVPLQPDLYLKYGAKLQGEVVSSTASTPTTPATLSLRFTALHYKGQTVPIATKAIAIANFTDADDTTVIATGSTDRQNSNPADWTTPQVGGDEVYRTGWVGPVCDDRMRTVGFADHNGVYSLPAPDAHSLPRAMGVFSTTAAGLYGLDEGTTLTSQHGAITLTRPTGKLLLRNGDNLLLEVIPPPS